MKQSLEKFKAYCNKEALKKDGVIDWNMSFILRQVIGKKETIIHGSGVFIDGREWFIDMSNFEFKVSGKAKKGLNKN